MTAWGLPDPERSVAVLIGVGTYTHLDAVPAARNGCKKLWQLLTERTVLGLPVPNCELLIDPKHTDELLGAVTAAAEAAEDTLLIYYSGHGVVDPEHGTLRLSVGLTQAQQSHTSVGWEEIRRALRVSRARRRIVILDCCHSGLMIESLSAGTDILPMTRIEGTYRLAACADDAVALALQGRRYTEFTGALVELLDNGVAGRGPVLSLDEIFEELSRTTTPRPRRGSCGDVGRAPFVLNRAVGDDAGVGPVPEAAGRDARSAAPAPAVPETPVPGTAAPVSPEVTSLEPRAARTRTGAEPETGAEPQPRRSVPHAAGPVPAADPPDRSQAHTSWWGSPRRTALAAGAAALVVTAGVVGAVLWPETAPGKNGQGGPGPSSPRPSQPTEHPSPTAPAATAGPCSPGAALLDFSDQLDDESYGGNRIVGLSGITMTGQDRALVVDDKNARLYELQLGAPDRLDVRPVGTTQLKDADGAGYADEEFDGEGLVAQGDSVLVASETAPSISRFDRAGGRLQEELVVPARFRPGPGSAAKASELLESLGMTPDGRHLYSGLQTALSSDSSNQGSDRLRLLHYRARADGGWQLHKQLAYPVEHGGELADLVPLAEGELLTLERSYHSVHGNTVQVFRTTLADRDVSEADDLGREPADVLARKELLFNLAACPQAGAKGNFEPSNAKQPLLANAEGMALGPELTEGRYKGRRVLYLVSDDNDTKEQLTRLYSFAVDVDR
ncbi:esterase-like activity of phytase family protein [Streptomyces sp. NPDC015127]|uniref:caspase, EACC1-associated type n=1 Tax=Streptomyces sp. NPDC015127 TaxID=3364939 RepID=UPI0037032A5F